MRFSRSPTSVFRVAVAQIATLPLCERSQRHRQLPRGRHGGSADGDWNDADVPLQRRGDLELNPILRSVRAVRRALVQPAQPRRADDRDEDAAGVDLASNGVRKARRGLDGIDVAKDGAFAEGPAERVEQPSRIPGRVGPAVAQKDRAHGARPVPRIVR
jgi:hypothetical protein